MKLAFNFSVALLLSFLLSAKAFSVATRQLSLPSVVVHRPILTNLYQSSSDDGDAPRQRKRRVRRKQVSSAEDAPKKQPVAEVAELKPRKESAVAMEVKDIRDLVGGTSSSSGDSSSPSKPSAPRMSTRTPSATSESSSGSSSSPAAAGNLDDSLQQLLADANEMKALSNDKDDSSSSEGGVMSTVRNAIGTIVTVDFFVVCLFLLWFLAGVFSSYVFKDDTIQIAFNSNFQMLVQPALGILMIAAIADAVTKEKDEDEMGN